MADIEQADEKKLRELRNTEKLQVVIALLQAGAAVAALYMILKRTGSK